jgi:hypothetical protein
MAHDTDLSDLPIETAGRPVDNHVAPSNVRVSMAPPNPNLAPLAEAVAACFAGPAEADKVAVDLVAAGIARDAMFISHDRDEKRTFLKRYVHRDSDQHTHSNAASAFAALGGAFAVGLICVVMAAQFTTGAVWPIVAAIVGGVIGAGLGSLLGGFALRPADDRSMAIVEKLCDGGTLVAVRAVDKTASLDEASRILSRHNGRAFRLATRPSQADLHPGDTRQFE